MSLTIGSLFSGVEGMGLGLMAAFEARIVYHVEKDPFCQRVLERHFPDALLFEDVCDVATAARPLPRTDIICGGWPCQGNSVAGRGLGLADERSGLWREVIRILSVVKPPIFIGENVPGLRTRGLEVVVGDLAAQGFDVAWDVLSAAHLGAPHLRRRFFIVAWQPAFADAYRRELRHLFERVSRRFTGRVRGGGQAVTRDDGAGRIVDRDASDAEGESRGLPRQPRLDGSVGESADAASEGRGPSRPVRSDDALGAGSLGESAGRGDARGEASDAARAGCDQPADSEREREHDAVGRSEHARRDGESGIVVADASGSGWARWARGRIACAQEDAGDRVASDTDGDRCTSEWLAGLVGGGAFRRVADGRRRERETLADADVFGSSSDERSTIERGGREEPDGDVVADASRARLEGRWQGLSPLGSWDWRLAPSAIRRVDDGDAAVVDRPRRRRRPVNDSHRLRALGNSCTPQQAFTAGLWALTLMVSSEMHDLLHRGER